MVQVIQPAETFGTQLAKSLTAGLAEKGASSGDFVMQLIKDKQRRVADAGQLAMQSYMQTHPNATSEDLLRVSKEGSEIARKTGDPSKIFEGIQEKQIGREREVERIKKDISPEAWWKKMTDIFTGENEKARQLKKEGLSKQLEKSDLTLREKRALLSQGKGFLNGTYSPEDVESILHPLSEDTKKTLESFPDLRPETKDKGFFSRMFDETFGERGTGLFGEEGPESIKPLSDTERQFVKSSLSNILQEHPDVDPLSLRKKFMEKGVAWDEYKNIFDEVQNELGINVFDNPEYIDIEPYMNEPPLGPLRRALKNSGIFGD